MARSSDLRGGLRKKTGRTLLLAHITTSLNTSVGSKGGRARRSVASLARRAEGQALVEYSLVLALVAAGLIVGFQSFGTTVLHLFNEIPAAFGA